MAYNNEQGSVSQDLQEGAKSAVNAAREAKQIAKAAGRAASGDLVGAAAEAAKSKTVRRLVAFSLAFLAFIIFCVGYLIPMTIYEGATSYAKGVVEEWRTLFYDESGTKADAGAFVRALSATGGTLKKVGLDIADVFKGLWNAIKGTKADDTDTDGATDADLGIMVDTDDLASVFERKFNATKDKFAGRAKQISKVIEQNSGNDSALGSAVLSRYNAVANSYIKDSSYDVQYGGFSLSVTPGKLSNKAAVTLMSLESIQHSISEGMKICRNGLMHTPETQHGILGEIGAALKRVREIGNRQQPSPNALGRYYSDFNYSQIRVNMHALDETGCCKVNQVEIKRNQFQQNGAVSRLPWYVCVTEFRAKPKERGNGATNYDPHTVKEKRSVYINVSDMDMYNATWSVGRFVELWYATVGQSVLIEGLRMKDAARNGGYSGQVQNYGNGQNPHDDYDDYDDGFDCGDFNGGFNGGYGDFQR